MPHKGIEILQDTLIVLGGSAVAMLTKVMLASADTADNAVARLMSQHRPPDGSLEMVREAVTRYDMVSWTLLPLVGALVACGGCVILAPPPTKREAAGRSIFGIFFAVCITQIAQNISWISDSIRVPGAKLLFGCLTALAVYGISKPFVVRWIRRSDRLGENLADGGAKYIENKIPGHEHPHD